jgi:class 3 adenylate cyclase/tetratricopeptide (TPR) repeat protein
MKTCASCGTENPDIARFCLACGSQLADAPAPQETRKVVTIVFSDLKGSTSLGEALDSEALREVMTRYFDAMRSELERHGGVIEKFIGDAVMAVFGLPRLHEDDALRAVRAAAGMQNALEELNVELQRHYGVQLANRTGVNTGEVVAGDPSTGQRLVTGDAVNVAARLEQAAGEREVLLGALTYRLVRDDVDVEEVEPLALKGKAEPVPAYRLVGVKDTGEVDVRRGVAFVGRDRELEILESVFRDAVTTRSARLATLVADAGVGKSRLTAEFVDRISDRAFTLGGRCLPYGDGITFWPLAEALKTASGIVNDDGADDALAKLAALADSAGTGVTERLAAMIGLRPEPFAMEELGWAMRRFLEHVAATQPVTLVVEDIHWAEATLLELLEQLVEAMDEVPVLVLCPARPALVDESPDWGTGERATRIEIGPLDADASRSMVESLLGGGSLEPDVLDRVVTAAEGNPLFAEQLLRMLVDEGVLERSNGTWRATGPLSDLHVPPTIQALLAARLDTLAASERSVIEPASVVGYVFAEAAVSALAPPEVSPRVASELTTLAQKHFVHPVEEGDESHHRFQHIMIRDTAYDGILKRARADLHERFVAWADQVNTDRAAEFDEILGYHLEQAWTYLSELGPLDDRGRTIGEEGSRRLAAAGRRAFARGDVPAAESLLGRAAALLPTEHPDRLRLLPDHGEALLMTGRFEEATRVLDESIRHAHVAPADAARAKLALLLVRLRTGAEGWSPETVEEDIHATISVFEAGGDEAGLAMAWRLLAWAAGTACRFGDAAEASRRAVEHARRAGDVRQERRAATAYAAAASLGPTLVDEAIDRCEAAMEQTAGDRQSEGHLLAVLAGLYAMQGEFDHARGLAARSQSIFEELGLQMEKARLGMDTSAIERLAGDLEGAARDLRTAYDALDAVGERFALSTIAGFLAQTLLERGDLEEASAYVERSRELTTEADIATQALWRYARGRILVRQGAPDEAEAIVREALVLLESTDAIVYQIEAHVALGEALIATGRANEARDAYERARALAETKGGVVILSGVLRRLEDLDAAPKATEAD